jgi:hypothetical protein
VLAYFSVDDCGRLWTTVDECMRKTRVKSEVKKLSARVWTSVDECGRLHATFCWRRVFRPLGSEKEKERGEFTAKAQLAHAVLSYTKTASVLSFFNHVQLFSVRRASYECHWLTFTLTLCTVHMYVLIRSPYIPYTETTFSSFLVVHTSWWRTYIV